MNSIFVCRKNFNRRRYESFLSDLYIKNCTYVPNMHLYLLAVRLNEQDSYIINTLADILRTGNRKRQSIHLFEKIEF